MKVSVQSTESVLIPVQEIVAGQAIDMTTYPVQIAMIADTKSPITTDWHTAGWETNALSGEHNAVITVGPSGTITLTVGAYRPWVKVSAPAETPVLRCPGLVRVF